MATLDELLAKLRGKSFTRGWDAIVTYDRNKANALLQDQSIERLQSANGYMQPIDTELVLGDAVNTRLRLVGLQLNTVTLAFHSTQQRSTDATLRCSMPGGMAITTIQPAGEARQVTRIEQQLPMMDADLTMHIDLVSSKGGTSEVGSVYLQLHEGTDFTSSFGSDSYTQRAVADYFDRWFKSLDSGRRRFVLGAVGLESIADLTPEYFDMRVVSRPDALHAGGGAIELYIRFRNGQTGDIPGADFPLLIPQDGPDGGYSGALLLSSRVLFDKVLRAQLRQDIGHGIAFADFAGGQDNAWVLRANAGSFSAPFDHHYTILKRGVDATFSSPLSTPFGPEGAEAPFTVQGDGTHLRIVWKKSATTEFSRVLRWDWPSGDDWEYGALTFNFDFQVAFKVAMDAVGAVEFRREPDERFELHMTGHEWLPDLGGGERSKINEVAANRFHPALVSLMERLAPPRVDTFLARNLLFPGRNAFLPKVAHMPGDLLVVGRLDHEFTVLPDQLIIAAGARQMFRTVPDASGLTWSLSGVRREEEGLGSIHSASGEYLAPSASLLPQGFRAVVVTATRGSGANKVSASTLINVVAEPVAVNPLFQVCASGQTRILTAAGLGGGALEATLNVPGNGGRLQKEAGNRWTYTAAAQDPNRLMVLDSIKVTGAGVSKLSYVLVIHGRLVMEIALREAGANGGGQLVATINSDEVPANLVTWEVIGKGGVDAQGRYTPSPTQEAGFDLITGVMAGDWITYAGYLAVPIIAAYPRGLRARRDLLGNVHINWDAVPAAVEYVVEGFDRKSTTTALQKTWLFPPGHGGIGPISLKARYASGNWSEPIVIRFVNMPG